MKFISRVLVSVLLLLSVCFISSGCGKNERQMALGGATMGTSYSIKCVVPQDLQEGELQIALDELLQQFDLALSNWNPQSWVSRFNASRSTDWQEAPQAVMEVVSKSLDLYRRSRGAFDITLSPLIERWGFGARERKEFPSESEVKALLVQVSSQYLEVDVKQNKIRKTKPELQFNASAIAKGYGVDLVAECLRQNKIENFLVEIGGEVRAQGRPMNKPTWQVGIRQPELTPSATFAGVIPLRNSSLATSGDYQNFFVYQGAHYTHILDPSTGYPVQHRLCSASVIAPNCALADGIATTCLVMGTQLSLQWVKQFPNCSVLLIEHGEHGGYQYFRSEGFPVSP